MRTRSTLALLASLTLFACDDAASGGSNDGAVDGMVDRVDSEPEKDSGVVDAEPDMADLDMEVEEDAAVDPDMAVEEDAAVEPDFGPDVGPPDDRQGGLGEPCPRGAEADCDEEAAPLCVFVGDNDIVPGTTAVCSRECDAETPCGDGFCCLQEAGGGRCLPAGFCAERANIGDPCTGDADCPGDAPRCATEAGTGARFCTTGCAAGGACPEGFCCDANLGGRPMGAICKPQELCPEPCADDDDCAAVQFCSEGACVPRAFACEATVDCPLGEICIDGECGEGQLGRLGESCAADDIQCGDGAPICYEDEDTEPYCTYACAFHRDCPATYCCLDLAGLGDDEGFFCTDTDCPPNLPCESDDECAPDEFCNANYCAPRGPMDVEPGGACEGPGDCAPVEGEEVDCVFETPGEIVRRGERASFDNPGPGICSAPCSSGADCREGECCRIALQIRTDFGRGYCVTGQTCEPPMGGGGGGGRTCNPSDCDPARFDRCVDDRFFGRVCSRPCESVDDCPGGYSCSERDGFCHPPNRCNEDANCGPDNRCVDERCVEGVRQCTLDDECGDLENLRCDQGRCEARDRPCAGQEDCADNEICFDGRCELAQRACDGDGDCRAGEGCVDNICEVITLDFGEACNFDDGFPCDPEAAPICLVDANEVPDGVCTTGCNFASDCPGNFCCLDSGGLGDPEFFVCAPEQLCDDGAAVVNARRPCAADDDCLGEDFCNRGFCFDDGDNAGGEGDACVGPGDCAVGGGVDHCVLPLEFGFTVGALESTPDAQGGGTCQPTCEDDADCEGCCRHVEENGQPVAFCLPVELCLPAGDPGDPCFPGADDECDPSTTDACIFVEASETSYCSNTCDDDADCGAGCCADTGDGLFCLQPADCP